MRLEERTQEKVRVSEREGGREALMKYREHTGCLTFTSNIIF